MPKMAVIKKPEGPVPGVIALAIKPATKPINTVYTQCIIVNLFCLIQQLASHA
jgi:hypothetical protein